MTDMTEALEFRYSETFKTGPTSDLPQLVQTMIRRGSCRQFKPDPVDGKLVRFLCSVALAAPTKSDLQQRDIILLEDADSRARLIDLIGTEAWVRDVPGLAVFCGNNRRQRLLHKMRGHAFVNDHLDAFFNAAVDAGIALSAFVTAAEALGLGCCPISAVRNSPEAVSALLGLPDHVFPVAGLAFGYPTASTPKISMRLPLSATVHTDRYCEEDIEARIAAYDAAREEAQPYSNTRAADIFGDSDAYGWSEDKSRQYALPERQSFGAFVRSKGFDLT